MSGKVVALPGAERAEDGLKFMPQALAAEPAPRATLIAVVDGNGDLDWRIFGELTYQQLAYLAAKLVGAVNDIG